MYLMSKYFSAAPFSCVFKYTLFPFICFFFLFPQNFIEISFTSLLPNQEPDQPPILQNAQPDTKENLLFFSSVNCTKKHTALKQEHKGNHEYYWLLIICFCCLHLFYMIAMFKKKQKTWDIQELSTIKWICIHINILHWNLRTSYHLLL